MTGTLHLPVLFKEVVDILQPQPTSVVLDGTVGLGGHAEAILERMGKEGVYIGLDLDEASLRSSERRLARFPSRIVLQKANFRDAEAVLRDHPDIPQPNAILLDLGHSSFELEESGRGFSFQKLEEPLDMRYDASAAEQNAAAILASGSEQRLASIFSEDGEEPLARQLARTIVERRREHPLTCVKGLVDVVQQAYARRRYRTRSRIHPATRAFQALRIAVNNELETLREALPTLCNLLAPEGRIAVISFHSLEDRIVKEFFRRESRGCICPPELPECRCGHTPRLRILTKHVFTPSSEEQTTNPRSRSAKLRAAEKLP